MISGPAASFRDTGGRLGHDADLAAADTKKDAAEDDREAEWNGVAVLHRLLLLRRLEEGENQKEHAEENQKPETDDLKQIVVLKQNIPGVVEHAEIMGIEGRDAVVKDDVVDHADGKPQDASEHVKETPMAEQNRRREKNRDNQCIYQENERMGEQKDKRTDHGTPRKSVGNQRHQKRQNKNLNDGIAERFNL